MSRVNRRVKRAIKKRLEDVTIFRNSAETRNAANGRPEVENYTEVLTQACVQNPTEKELLALPEGERSKEARSFWFLEPVDTTDEKYADIIFARGKHWKIAKVWDRELGEYWKCIGTRYNDSAKQYPILPVVP